MPIEQNAATLGTTILRTAQGTTHDTQPFRAGPGNPAVHRHDSYSFCGALDCSAVKGSQGPSDRFSVPTPAAANLSWPTSQKPQLNVAMNDGARPSFSNRIALALFRAVRDFPQFGAPPAPAEPEMCRMIRVLQDDSKWCR